MAAIVIAPNILENTNSVTVHSLKKVSSSVFFFLPVSAFWEFSLRFLISVNAVIILHGRVLTQVLSHPCILRTINFELHVD